jgi:hypothetical protein
MKKILSIFLLFFALQSMAQGNLQFNQVINIKNGDTYTVPAGKVLKIISINQGPNQTFTVPLLRCDYYYGSYNCVYDLNIGVIGKIGNLIFKINPSSSVLTGTSVSQCSQCPSTAEYLGGNTISAVMPIWLKSGEIISINPGNGILISAIEFNIVP